MSDTQQFDFLDELPDEESAIFDAFIGARLKTRRLALGLSQNELAEVLGVTFQQIQKYERGGTSISAVRLWDIASTLKVDVSYFFDGLVPFLNEMGYEQSEATVEEEPVVENLLQETEENEDFSVESSDILPFDFADLDEDEAKAFMPEAIDISNTDTDFEILSQPLTANGTMPALADSAQDSFDMLQLIDSIDDPFAKDRLCQIINHIAKNKDLSADNFESFEALLYEDQFIED